MRFTCTGIPEEKIDPPTGLPKGMRPIGNKPRCPLCEAKGAVECATCSGTGLYVDSILESQGIIVKVRCLGTHFSGCFGSNSTFRILNVRSSACLCNTSLTSIIAGQLCLQCFNQCWSSIQVNA